ncbi:MULTISPECIES: LrgB family protein [Bacillus]|uniref:Murein hydrolase export regulator n=2 Tax=Bacillus cereus group TaxID=86661 RepID=R8Q3U5_BACCE|nr:MULTISPECIES: LrgB family protein [Bacillus cereus group]EOP65786.1 murein hydrolase export regulator [Bacillus cereus VD118]MBJ8093555.1 LrgB family protein [Bacillus cereus]MCQ6358482.1 LrgB family protein [Bacillus cereus]QWG46119.1 LrgB family protein [Bacillus mycoides]QWH13208.1 LrgB family protein [Bacillus mycoides]
MVLIFITVVIYLLAIKLYKKFTFPFTLPVLTVTAIMICIFLIFGISHQDYKENGGDILSSFLSPAIVALAIPLFKERKILMKNFLSILVGVVIGIVALISLNVVIGEMLNIDKELILTTIPQLATMPIAISLAEQIGGIPSMTASFVVVAGITGAIMGPTVLKLFRITSTIGKGVGMGCASHIIGVSRLVKEGEKEATIGSVTMIVTGILISILVPYGMKFLF